jgi:hypothetical protein
MSSAQVNQDIDSLMREWSNILYSNSKNVMGLMGWYEDNIIYNSEHQRYLSVTFKTNKSWLYEKFVKELNRCNYEVNIMNNKIWHGKGYTIDITFSSIIQPVIIQPTVFGIPVATLLD